MTEDQLTRDMLASTATVYNCTGGNNGDLPSNLSLSDIDDVTSAMLTDDAWMVLRGEEGEDRFGTGPIRDSFLVLAHTRLSKDLNNINGFIAKWNYPNDNRILPSEWGSITNTRWMLSSVASVTPNSSALGRDVFNNFFCGMESYAVVEQDNFSSRFLYRPPVYSDPLFQNVTIGYVTAQVPRLLNDLWLINARCSLR